MYMALIMKAANAAQLQLPESERSTFGVLSGNSRTDKAKRKRTGVLPTVAFQMIELTNARWVSFVDICSY